jgi:hypothetical protein
MVTRRIHARVCPKRGTTAEWEATPLFIPLEGEFIIYTDRFQMDDGTVVPGVKVGDGVTPVGNLPFIGGNSTVAARYDELEGLPSINGTRLIGNVTLEALGIQEAGKCPDEEMTADDVDAIIDDIINGNG